MLMISIVVSVYLLVLTPIPTFFVVVMRCFSCFESCYIVSIDQSSTIRFVVPLVLFLFLFFISVIVILLCLVLVDYLV